MNKPQKSWKRKKAENERKAIREAVERNGLLFAGKEASLFRQAEIGEAHVTTGKVELWYAPAYLVRLNRYLMDYGISRKIRLRSLRHYVEGKPWPQATDDAMAGYTEHLLLQR